MDKVSVIIPAYNVEKYIFRAIESVLQQSYENIELVIVDDGSTDKTWDIIQKYVTSDCRVVARKQMNMGVSAARNYALKLISGRYVMFLDSDDWLEEDTAKILIELQEMYPSYMVSGDRYFAYFNNDGSIRKERQRRKAPVMQESLEEALANVGTGKYNLQSACYKIFDVSILQKNNLYFNSEISHGEDGLFVFLYLNQCNGIIFDSEPLWNILERPGSVTMSPYNKNWLTAITAAEIMLKYPVTSIKVKEALIGYVINRIEMVENAALMSNYPDRNDVVYLKRKLAEYGSFLYMSKQPIKEIIKYVVYEYMPVSILIMIINIKNGLCRFVDVDKEIT